MPIWKRWSSEGAQWGIWKVTETLEELRAQLVDEALPYAEELEQYKALSRKMEYLAVRVLLKELTGEEKQIAHYPSGQPYLVADRRKISISHTKGYAAVGIHAEALPGIDIEQVGERARKIASRFMRDDEMAGGRQYAPQEELLYLLLHWSAKETLFKLLEEEEVDFLAHLQILPFALSASKMQAVVHRTVSPQPFELNFEVSPEYVCTWGIKSKPQVGIEG